MSKTIKTIAIALLLTLSTVINAQTKSVDVAGSTINWTGKKVTGQHTGTLAIKSGSLIFKKTKLTGGNFVVDMTTLANTDLKAGAGKEDLEGHLKSADFFGIDKFTTASLVFKKVAVKALNVYTVTGDLTIKGIVKPITFDLATTANTASTALKVDRTKYDIKYGSGNFFQNLGDKVISDEFELAVALKF
jgi:polyisoprenoid-binding protein YceI